MRILVTGGTGHLGAAVAARLVRDGEVVRVLTRRPRASSDIEWIAGDLATGDGVEPAVTGVDVIVHAATHSPAAQRGRFLLRDAFGSPGDVDVRGTAALLSAAERAGVEHFVHVSIVGLEALRRMPYARRKLEAEALVRAAAVPWSIVRATGFYWLLDRMFSTLARRRVLALPARASMAPVDSDDFAGYVADVVQQGPRGDRQGFAGPQTLTMIALMEEYLRARSISRRVRRAPLPRGLERAITAGNTSSDARLGTTTWAQWLSRHPEAKP